MAGVVTRKVCDRNARIAEWQARWDELRDSIDAILAERGHQLADEAAGGSTGFLCKDYNGVGTVVGDDGEKARAPHLRCPPGAARPIQAHHRGIAHGG